MNPETKNGQETVTLEPDGSVVLPSHMVENYVLASLGCKLWFNDKNIALGIRILRGVDEPPWAFELIEDPEGRRARIDAASFLRKQGYTLPEKPAVCPAQYYPKYHMLEVKLPGEPAPTEPPRKNIMDDFEAIPD